MSKLHVTIFVLWLVHESCKALSWVPRIAHVVSIPPVGQSGLVSGAEVCEPSC